MAWRGQQVTNPQDYYGGLALIAVAGPDDPAPAGFDFVLREPVNLEDLRRVLGCLPGAPPSA